MEQVEFSDVKNHQELHQSNGVVLEHTEFHSTTNPRLVEFCCFKRLDMRIGKVMRVERIPKTEKLYKLQVDIGKEEPIQIVTSLVPYYKEEELLNKNIVVLLNLKPTKFAGEVSQGMLLCAEKEDGSECVLLTTEKGISTGTKVT